MITTVKAGWRKIGFRFDALSVLLLCEMYEIEINELDKIDSKQYLPSWTWCAHRSYQMRRNRRVHIQYPKMQRLLAGLRMNEHRKIEEAILRVTPKDKDGNIKKVPGDKKKRHGMTSM